MFVLTEETIENIIGLYLAVDNESVSAGRDVVLFDDLS
jgi:hypothetical protein